MKKEVTIMWLDTQETVEVTVKIGLDVEEDDDDIFFYFKSEKDMDSFRTKGVNDFIII
jgi:hypothetical protein